MTTTPDFRALCKELVELLEDEWSGVSVQPEALTRARTALATPPPEPPTDEELDELFTEIDQSGEALSWRAFARAVLKRWGNQTTITQTHHD